VKMRSNWYDIAQSLGDIKIVEMKGYPTDTEFAQVVLLTGLIIISEVLNNNLNFDSISPMPTE